MLCLTFKVLHWIGMVRVDILFFFLILKERLSVFFPFNMILAVGLLYSHYSIEVWSFYIYFLLGLYYEMMLSLLKAFSLSVKITVIFTRDFIYVAYYVYCFKYAIWLFEDQTLPGKNEVVSRLQERENVNNNNILQTLYALVWNSPLPYGKKFA